MIVRRLLVSLASISDSSVVSNSTFSMNLSSTAEAFDSPCILRP